MRVPSSSRHSQYPSSCFLKEYPHSTISSWRLAAQVFIAFVPYWGAVGGYLQEPHCGDKVTILHVRKQPHQTIFCQLLADIFWRYRTLKQHLLHFLLVTFLHPLGLNNPVKLVHGAGADAGVPRDGVVVPCKPIPAVLDRESSTTTEGAGVGPALLKGGSRLKVGVSGIPTVGVAVLIRTPDALPYENPREEAFSPFVAMGGEFPLCMKIVVLIVHLYLPVEIGPVYPAPYNLSTSLAVLIQPKVIAFRGVTPHKGALQTHEHTFSRLQPLRHVMVSSLPDQPEVSLHCQTAMIARQPLPVVVIVELSTYGLVHFTPPSQPVRESCTQPSDAERFEHPRQSDVSGLPSSPGQLPQW
ncbi:hypothetical protein [Pseudomonas phage vB_PaeM_RP7]|nr:hypothetical protein [Pseudomonas phage vB_PaeM_RP15]WAB56941.1 hypothetical protein [Pseudomonas phage vB_PaeM_RP6]WAB57150.1 hypothetical protein [Pseudomonas phage vB_PaeM_RP7]WAB57287.1 hypothetical protein [Pseudomonas phage vB_PaeM_RP8]WAB57453.1 hypothetical protein [Pseudomonas phage vB_PaeM_RP9]WAB57568.1 hypothetical protein [Pseudomonas phage vB_PaeM_RP10]WAB57857.1 hypothetical protein [Pseudomonas phage vB_PaeM_RP11]WAB57967.1 hypothetical protein [Pseudomonas phage vB_PaeM_R